MLINSQLFRFLNHSPPPWAKFVIYDKAFLTPRSPTPTNPVWPSVPTVVLRTRVSSAPLPRAAFLHDSRRRGQPRLSPLRSPGAGSTVDPGRGSLDPGRGFTGGSGYRRTSYSACTISTSTHCSATVAMVSHPASGRRVTVASNSAAAQTSDATAPWGGAAGSCAQPAPVCALFLNPGLKSEAPSPEIRIPSRGGLCVERISSWPLFLMVGCEMDEIRPGEVGDTGR